MKLPPSIALLIGFVFLSSCVHKEKPKNVTAVSSIERIKIQNPATQNSQTPRLFSTGKELYFSWVTTDNTTNYLNYSVLKDTTWRKAETIISGDNWFTNWADFPAIAESDGNILTSFLQKSATGTYTYDVKFNLYHADTRTWQKNLLLNTDGTESEHGFVSIAPNPGGQFFVSWLDGRNTVRGGAEMNHDDGHPGDKGAMTLRGAYIGEHGEVLNETELDYRVCDCCQTSATMTLAGPVVVYRDRSENEVRDISIVTERMHTGWVTPKSVYADNWEIEGCPVNGPSVASFGNTIAVAWFTGAMQKQIVQVAFKKTGQKDFDPPIKINSEEALGRVDILMLDEEEAVVSWMEFDGENALVRMMKVTANGTKATPLTVSKTSSQRSSGFPQIELLNGYIYVAVTIVDEERISSIETYKVPLDTL